MLSLPNDGRYPALELAPQQRRQRTLAALILQLEALTRSSPVLMIFEDAHWIDPTSLEALGRVVDRIVTLRVLLIMTFRSEFDPPWIGQPHVTTMTIGRLTQREAGAMIDRVVGNKLLPASIRRDIIERTDGIPLFVEEMTRAVLEAESEAEARRTAAAVPSPALAVPATLHASLMARLDRLGSAKDVAQIGATIGREFSHSLLALVVRKPEAELASALSRLAARDTRVDRSARQVRAPEQWPRAHRPPQNPSCQPVPVRVRFADPAPAAGATCYRASRPGRSNALRNCATASVMGRARGRLLTGLEPVADGLLAMLCRELRPSGHDLRELVLQRHHNPRMKLLTTTAEQGAVGRVLHKGMLEGVLRVRRCPAPED
jgi:hypothetical protein